MQADFPLTKQLPCGTPSFSYSEEGMPLPDEHDSYPERQLIWNKRRADEPVEYLMKWIYHECSACLKSRFARM